MQDIWIRNPANDDEDMLNLRDCINIYKRNEKNEYGTFFRIKIIYQETNLSITFDTEKQRNNFYDHVRGILKPVDLDPNKKPITL